MIKCDLCSYEFKTHTKIVREFDYDDRCYYDVPKEYILPEENAHLVRNYICNNCYTNITEVVKSQLLAKGDDFLSQLDKRVDEEHSKYLKRIEELNQEQDYVQQMCDKIRNVGLFSNLTSDDINEIINKFPYTTGATFYLDRVNDIELKNMGYKRFDKWAEFYGIDIDECLGDVSQYELISKDRFKEEIMNCTFKNKTLKEIIEILKNIE